MRAAYIFGCLALLAVGCDKGTTSDPKTVLRGDLNPPVGLVTITGHNQIELRWGAANTEKDFKGFHVFAVESTLATLGDVKYPANVKPTPTLAAGSVPRCFDNTKIFETFGFPAIESGKKECEGGVTATTSGSGSAVEGAAMAAETGSAAASSDDKITFNVPCKESSDATISLAAAAPQLVQQTCTLTKYYDTTAKALKDMADGHTYVIFVVAVQGDDHNEISWTSNFVQDTPSTPLFSGELTFSPTKSLFLPVAKVQAMAAVTATDFQEASCVDDVCKVNTPNSLTTEIGLYFGRAGTGNFPQRVFFSVPKVATSGTLADGEIAVQARGPQTNDPKDNSFQTSIPGDMAAAEGNYEDGGKLYPVYGNQVFDIKFAKGGTFYFGKVVISNYTTPPADGTSDVKATVTLIVQPEAKTRDYFE